MFRLALPFALALLLAALPLLQAADPSTAPATATAPARQIPLSSIYVSSSQEGAEQVHDGPFPGEATPLATAFGWAKTFKDLTKDTMVSAKAGEALTLQQPADGGLWVAIHLGVSGGDPPQYLVDAVSFPKAGEIAVAYHRAKAGPMTKDVHAYRVWIPMGRLAPGKYLLQITSQGKVEATHSFVVTAP